MPERDELDRILDAALARYSDCESLAGIEERVLHRVAQPRRRRWLWWLATAVPVAASLLVILTSRETAEPPRPVPIVAQHVPAPEAVPAPPAAAPVRRAVKIKAAKLDRFPAAAPLTDEERRLIELASIAPDALQPAPMMPIEIEPIEIKPLETIGMN